MELCLAAKLIRITERELPALAPFIRFATQSAARFIESGDLLTSASIALAFKPTNGN